MNIKYKAMLPVNSLLIVLGLVIGNACTGNQTNSQSANKSENEHASLTTSEAELDPAKTDTATFAGGCFWCVEAVFERVNGVMKVVSGYSGGEKPDPTYKEVAGGRTDYAEAVQIYYDASLVRYNELLEIFFATHDPTQLNRQGPDVGKQYRTAVFYHNGNQKEAVNSYIEKLENSGKYKKPIVTEVNAYKKFYVAEQEHQNFYEKHPNHPYIQMWAVPKVDKLKKRFSDMVKETYL